MSWALTLTCRCGNKDHKTSVVLNNETATGLFRQAWRLYKTIVIRKNRLKATVLKQKVREFYNRGVSYWKRTGVALAESLIM